MPAARMSGAPSADAQQPGRKPRKPTTMKLKLDEAGHVVVTDGKPVYVNDAGNEIAFDVPAAAASITALRGEAMRHRQDKEAAETALKAFDGIADPGAARKALETIKGLDENKLVAAGERDAAIAAAVKAKDDEYRPIIEERDALKTSLFSEKVGGAFARSKFVTESLVLPPDIAETYFGKHFKIEGGKTIAYDASGNQIYAKANPGQPADFDEAIAALVDQYPRKESILKSQVGAGGGASQPGPGAGGQRTMNRADFSKLAPADAAAFAKDVGAGKAALVD